MCLFGDLNTWGSIIVLWLLDDRGGILKLQGVILKYKNMRTIKIILKKVLIKLKEWGKAASYAVNHGNNR